MEKVILCATAFGSAMGPRTDYVSLLSALATALFHIDDMETARLLFTAAFANATPTHLSESITGVPEAAEQPEQRTTWASPPTVVRELRPIYKGNAERATEKPLRHTMDALLKLRQEHDEQLSYEQDQLKHLFQTPLLDLASSPTIEDEEIWRIRSIWKRSEELLFFWQGQILMPPTSLAWRFHGCSSVEIVS